MRTGVSVAWRRTPGLEPERARIARGFGAAAGYYETHAAVQRSAADRILRTLAELDGLPGGAVLEIGCGTGFISRELVRHFPDRMVELTDLSEGMLEACRASLPDSVRERVRMRLADGEHWNDREYAVIVAGLVAQWFSDPLRGLERLADSLSPSGVLVASLLVAGSFSEWRSACEDAGVPFSGRRLPQADRLLAGISRAGFEVSSFEEELRETHESPLAFFRHLRSLGADGGPGTPPLSPGEFRRLMRRWERGSSGAINVSYRTLFVRVRRLDRTP
jgi:malonyl-CoA O-methyltransferase